MPSPSRRSPLRPILFILGAIAVVVFAVEGGEYGTLDLLKQRRARARLGVEIDSLQHVVDSLRRYRDQLLRDPRVQERIAREEFGMVRGDKELLYRFTEPESASASPPSRPR